MGDQDSQDSQPSSEAAHTMHSLLQRINSLEIYVSAQDQRIHQLEAIIEKKWMLSVSELEFKFP